MEGRALSWFQWLDSHDPFTDWRDLKAAIIHWFSCAKDGDPMEWLMALRHDSSVTEFRDQFEALAASIMGLHNLPFLGLVPQGIDGSHRITSIAEAVITLGKDLSVNERAYPLLGFSGNSLQFNQGKEQGPSQKARAEEEDEGDEELVVDEEPTTEEIEGVAGLSLNSLMGITSSNTMKLMGTLGDREVVVLVDSGASHNFLSQKVMREMQIPLTATGDYGIQVGNSACFRQHGMCKGVDLRIQGYRVTEDFVPFELGCTEVVLGVSWLRMLGEVSVNWQKFMTKFKTEEG
ncbi:uncharacterized protein LOC112091991 [Morus notabilis]|uniref:uncharacterized protein LOC112091991 n=1 Tax=Morus notabilis TaxID=981085 RepID=UPI000CED5330|nr:uncharacterized protein LOC112091991 [Morus notabilis]